MSDNYQAVYDAVRSRFVQCDIGAVVREVLLGFDFGQHALTCASQEIAAAATAPSVLYRPLLFQDGDQWCALLGENIHEGYAAFGATPAEAMKAFDQGWAKS